ncbi:MAG: hypothetical protein U0638_00830 [Phycisphaerales bacterium]
MTNDGPRRKWSRWPWLLARGVVLGLLLMWGVWWVNWRWFDGLSQTTYVVRRGGSEWMVFESCGLWDRSMNALRSTAGVRARIGPNDVLVERLPCDRHDRVLETIPMDCQLVLYEQGSLWPALSGFEVYRSGALLGQTSLTAMEPFVPGFFPTHIHWPGILAWLAVFGVLGSAMWEAPKLAWRAMVRWRRVRLGLCRRCGYSLEGISGGCPECGRAREGKENAA